MNKKLLKNFTTACSVFVAVLLIILAFGKIDYNISLLLLDRESVWAEFFNIFGEQPAFWGLLIGSVILFFSHEKSNKKRYFICLVSGFCCSYSSVYYMLITPVLYISERYEIKIFNNPKAIITAVSLIISIIITAIAPKYKSQLKKFRNQGAFLILTILSEIALVNILKYIWGRPRMRSISSFEEFRYWYEIAGPAASQEFRSFPSGHTANAFTIIAFCKFIPDSKKNKARLFFSFALLWGTLVAISRVVLGAHFLSDVTTGFYVTLLCIYCYYCMIFKK